MVVSFLFSINTLQIQQRFSCWIKSAHLGSSTGLSEDSSFVLTMKSLIFILILSYALFSRETVLNKQSLAENSQIVRKILINFLAEHIFDDRTFISFVVTKSRNSTFQRDLIEAVISEPAFRATTYYVLHKLSNGTRHRRKTFNVILVEDSETLEWVWDRKHKNDVLIKNITQLFDIPFLRQILVESKLREYHLSLKYLIVIDHTENTTIEMLTRIFKVLWANGLTNAHVLTQNEFGTWSLDTFFPYRSDCTELDHVRIASFTPMNFTRNINLSMNQLYPEKLKNFNRCPLFVAATRSSVYVIHNTLNGIDQYSGIDINIIEQISKTLNFRIVYKPTDKHGDVFDNGTLTGSIKLVRTHYSRLK